MNSDLTRLTAEELRKYAMSYHQLVPNDVWAEISRRLERLERCEADSKILDWLERMVFNGDVTFYVSPVTHGIVMTYRDAGTHSCQISASNIRDAARTALEGK